MKKHILNNGYVELIYEIGDINTVVNRQRISYNKKQNEFTLKDNINLISFLLKNEHMTPFEQVYFEWELKVPIFVQRQLERYRMTSINEISGRYSDDLKYDFYIPNIIRIEGKNDISEEINERIIYEISQLYEEIKEKYKRLRKKYKVTKELQRIIEPIGQYTIFRWSMNLRELIHIFKQRLDKHQQYETREAVKQMYEITKEKIPILMKLIDNKMQEVD